MKNNLCALLILTFSLSIIAPACGFVWGNQDKSFIEICTAKGIEKRLVQNDSAPTEHQTQEQCQFCFANAHLVKDLVTPETITISFTFISHHYFKNYQTAIKSALTRAYQSRAPPFFV